MRQVVVEALARHEPVAKTEDHDEAEVDLAAGRRDAEERADVQAAVLRLGDVGAVRGPPARAAGGALDRDAERLPPLPIVRLRAGPAAKDLSRRDVLEDAVLVQRRQ